MSNQTIALIVGGSSGMGLATAKLLAQDNIKIIITGRSQSKLDAAKVAIAGNVETIQADLYNQEDVNTLIAFINNQQDPIKYLVTAAGYFKPVSFLEHTPSDYQQQMDINQAFFFISQAVAKNMKTNQGGNIVNIGSMWANQAVKATPSSAYSMQKAGLHALTKNLAIELAEYNIRVNAVAPAVVLSTIYKSFINETDIPEALSGFNDFHPLGRIGQPQDVADAIYYLLSDKASWITGTIMNIDGGVMAGRNQ